MNRELDGSGISDEAQSGQTVALGQQPVLDDAADAGSGGTEGEILPSEECGALGGALLTGAAIGLGVLVLGAIASDSQPSKNFDGEAGRPKGRSKRRASAKPSHPLLPQWLFDLDQIRQNTIEERRSLSTEGCYGVKTDTDAIILLGYLVKRKVAIKATGLLGHEALVYSALHKCAFLRATKRWLSNRVDYTPVAEFDEEDAETLAVKIEQELCEMPLWSKFVSRTEIRSLRSAIKEILSYHDKQRMLARARADEARARVSWKSRKRPGPGEAYYDSVAPECGRVIFRSEEIEKVGRSALSDLYAGRVVSARAFIAKHRIRKTSPAQC